MSGEGFWHKAAGARWQRRRLFQAAGAGAGLAGITLAGCGTKTNAPGSSQGGGTASNQPKRGGTLTLSDNFQRGFDPHILQATDTGSFGQFYSTLIRANPRTNELEPDLATKWESPSQTELVFTLAPNIKWHDKPPASGRALKPDDIIFSFKRIQTDDPRFINKAYLSSIDKLEAPDDHTLKLTLKSPDVTQLSNLSVLSLKILAPEVVDKGGKLGSADAVVGTGAFVLQTSEVGVGSKLVRNPAYFKPGLPYADRVELKAFTDYGTEWAAFLAGQLDHRWVPGQDSAAFASQKKDQYRLDWFPDLGYDIIQANVSKPPFNDARVTRALRLLVDHDEFKTQWAAVWYGRARYSAVFAAATADSWDLSEDEYKKYLEWQQPKDNAIKEALSLLSAAGITKDKPLKFTLSGTNGSDYQVPMSQLLQAQLKRNSQGAVDCDIKLYDTTAWTQIRSSSNFEYYVGGHNAGGADPDATFSSTYKTKGGRNYGRLSDPQLDQMIDKQRAIFDEKQRKQAVREIVTYLIDHSPYGSVDARYVLNAAALKTHDFPVEGTTNKFGEHYENVWLS
ncbi:MAG TPA: ABC transporter substrate-binding protein [Dehalococcoidia bacterium]|nr:ABC transporter substrate-binding protein [Dehalococcoidia bacterium]